jgi:hypothetical protein
MYVCLCLYFLLFPFKISFFMVIRFIFQRNSMCVCVFVYVCFLFSAFFLRLNFQFLMVIRLLSRHVLVCGFVCLFIFIYVLCWFIFFLGRLLFSTHYHLLTEELKNEQSMTFYQMSITISDDGMKKKK